jgi:hypothetical protein
MKKYLVEVAVFSVFSTEVYAEDKSCTEKSVLETHFDGFLSSRDYDLEVLEIEEIK